MPVAFVLYTPLDVLTDKWIYARKTRRPGGGGQRRRRALMDVRMLTVGPVQENCFIARARRRATAR